MNKTEKKIIYFSFVLLMFGLYGITLGFSLIQIGACLLFLIMVFLYTLKAKKMRSKELRTSYLISVVLVWGTFAMLSSVSLIQLVVVYLSILSMVLYVRGPGKENVIEIPLSDIEINDIRLSEEEYIRGETQVFNSVEEMLDHIGEEE